MGQDYEQLSQRERVEIYRWHAEGKSARWIGEALGRHHSTICRELARNSQVTKQWDGGYEPLRAHQLALRRRQWDCRFKLARQPALRRHVRDKLAMGWSPEAIAGRLARDKSSMRISHEAIYRYAYFRCAQKDYWHRLLPQRKHRRGWLGRRGGSAVDHIKHRVSIARRPRHVESRKQAGHWEADVMNFSDRRQNLLVAQERRSRFIFMTKMKTRKSPLILGKLKSWLARLPESLRRSLTQDNGTEFALHYKLTEALGIATFFCDPHSPWQKGGIENMNGRLRRSLPLKCDLNAISPAKIAAIARRHNDIPRKCLGFKTAKEVFNDFLQPSHFKRESACQLSLA
ncbi:MAG: IS30 family transposase [Rhizobiales bacterium]|nr:IS30 family transposase [Hyphomicrobiales bacterium]